MEYFYWKLVFKEMNFEVKTDIKGLIQFPDCKDKHVERNNH